MSDSEIEHYLDQLSGSLASEGQGRFTVNALTHSKGLLEAAALHPFRWVYFAIQAAVCARASDVRVSDRGPRVGVDIQLSEIDPEFLSADWIPGEGLKAQSAFRFWSQAMLWAAALEPISVNVLCEGLHPGYLILLEGERAHKQPLPPQDRRTRLALVVHLANQSKRHSQLTAYLKQNLTREMAYVNLPVRHEGREAAWGYPVFEGYRRVALSLAGPQELDALGFIMPCQLDFGEYRLADRRGFLFREASMEAAQLDLSGAVGSRKAVRTELQTSWNYLSLRKGPWGQWLLPLDYVPKIPGTSLIRCRSLAFFRPGKPARLFPVQHGLCLRPIPVPEAPPGWEVFWPAPHQQTDYPGLEAVQDENLAELRRQAVAWISTRHL